MLPPRYQNGKSVSAALVAAAPLVYDADGKVAWDHIWGHDDPEQPFCDLALAGGPPHRGTLLEPVDPQDVRANPDAYAQVLAPEPSYCASDAPATSGLGRCARRPYLLRA